MKDKETLNMIIGSFFVIFISLIAIGFVCCVYTAFSPFVSHISVPNINEPQQIPLPPTEVTEPVVIPTLDATQWDKPNIEYNFTYIVVGGGGGGGYYNTTGARFYINSTGGSGYGQSNFYQWG